MQEPIDTPENPSPTVTCADCGAVIDRTQARPIVAQAQVGEVVDMSRRYRCADRERCEARGPIAQSAEQLRADLEAAQTVIEALKADKVRLLTELDQSQQDTSRLGAYLEDAEQQLNAARGAQASSAVAAQEALERQARARLVREIEFVRAVRALALRLKRDRPCPVSITAWREANAQLTAIEQDELLDRMADAERVKELEAERDKLKALLYEADVERRAMQHHIDVVSNIITNPLHPTPDAEGRLAELMSLLK